MKLFDGITVVGVVTGVASAAAVLLKHLDVLEGTASPEETIATAALALGGLLVALGGRYAKVWAEVQAVAREIAAPDDAATFTADVNRRQFDVSVTSRDGESPNAAELLAIATSMQRQLTPVAPPVSPPQTKPERSEQVVGRPRAAAPIAVGLCGAEALEPEAVETADGKRWEAIVGDRLADLDGVASGSTWAVSLDPVYARTTVSIVVNDGGGEVQFRGFELPASGFTFISIPEYSAQVKDASRPTPLSAEAFRVYDADANPDAVPYSATRVAETDE